MRIVRDSLRTVRLINSHRSRVERICNFVGFRVVDRCSRTSSETPVLLFRIRYPYSTIIMTIFRRPTSLLPANLVGRNERTVRTGD